MFESILVSLDGSALAEQALAPAFTIAAQFGATVLLLRVVVPERPVLHQPPLVPPPFGADAETLRSQVREAHDYLTRLELPLPRSGLLVHTRVLVGAPPASIVATATDSTIDLIVMSTHGRTGLTRLLYGSVAEAVLRGSPVPVLMIPNRARPSQTAAYADQPPADLVAGPLSSGLG